MAFEMRVTHTGGRAYKDWTAREHLAAMAMQGLCATLGATERYALTRGGKYTDGNNGADHARLAFNIADAMLAEAEKRDG